jgi:lipoyl-dependent peroxiredoxin
VTLRVELGRMNPTAAEQLGEAAHQACPYSHATHGDIPVFLETVTA